ncbi:hypothetical protein BOX24_03470 [Leptospirillum ferriphilum]|uniref:Transglycosylase SLT domain-containing protein n=2 Tax=Leptospirillum ferriphilum TaxID=178606 RepID=A0A1V3SYB5_9BACT|nr:hypothetical protein BOX24_03470 [Leptospirillum ferriphilum]
MRSKNGLNVLLKGGALASKGFSLFLFLFCLLLLFPYGRAFSFPDVREGKMPDVSIVSRYIALHAALPLPASLCRKIARRLLFESRREHIPPYVALAIAEQESSFNPQAFNSKTEDYGLFQVHFPFWKRYFARKSSGALVPLKPEELFNLGINIRVGLLILRHDIDLEKGDIARGIGRYSGRKGEKRMVYEQQVVAREVRFLAYWTDQRHAP